MQTMLVVSIQTVVIQVYVNDVGERHLVHIRQRVARTMKYKWDQRQWFPQT